MITLSEQEVNDLLNYVKGIPYQYANPIVQFLTSKLPQQEQPQPEPVEDERDN